MEPSDRDLVRLILETLGLLGAAFAWFVSERQKKAADEARREAEARRERRLEEERQEKKIEQARRDAWQYRLNNPDRHFPYDWRGGGDL